MSQPPRDGTAESLSALQVRAERALEALAESSAVSHGGLEAVAELQQRVKELAPRLGVDIREVQESVVEHAAMYANCPEVLGGMLQLVFCLDDVSSWRRDMEARAKFADQRVQDVEYQFRQQSDHISVLNAEVEDLVKRSAALTVAADFRRASRAAKGAQEEQEARGVARDAAQTAEELARLREDNTELIARLAAAERSAGEAHAQVGDLASQVRVAQASADASAAEAAAAQAAAARAEEAQATTQTSSGALPIPAAPLPSSQFPPCTSAAEAMLLTLEQLEPMLAALSAGGAPELDELQEEACDAYGQLRAAVLEAVSMQAGHAPPLAHDGHAPGRAASPGTFALGGYPPNHAGARGDERYAQEPFYAREPPHQSRQVPARALQPAQLGDVLEDDWRHSPGLAIRGGFDGCGGSGPNSGPGPGSCGGGIWPGGPGGSGSSARSTPHGISFGPAPGREGCRGQGQGREPGRWPG